MAIDTMITKLDDFPLSFQQFDAILGLLGWHLVFLNDGTDYTIVATGEDGHLFVWDGHNVYNQEFYKRFFEELKALTDIG